MITLCQRHYTEKCSYVQFMWKASYCRVPLCTHCVEDVAVPTHLLCRSSTLYFDCRDIQLTNNAYACLLLQVAMLSLDADVQVCAALGCRPLPMHATTSASVLIACRRTVLSSCQAHLLDMILPCMLTAAMSNHYTVAACAQFFLYRVQGSWIRMTYTMGQCRNLVSRVNSNESVT